MTNEAHDEKDEVQAPETEWARRYSAHLRSDVSGCNVGYYVTNRPLLYQNVCVYERKGLWEATPRVLRPGACQKATY
jgi:hypothetical protein